MADDDPERSLPLLWGTRERPSRGPKPGLSVEAIVRVAIELADAEGLEAVSMRRVAERLGFTTMSLYRYVSSKAVLIDVMQDAALGEVDWRALPAADWRAGLTEWARAGWTLNQRHPWTLVIATRRRLPGPNEVDCLEAGLRTLADTGLRGSEQIAAVTMLGRWIQASASEVARAERNERRTGISDEQWWGSREAYFEHFTTERFPRIAALWYAGDWNTPEDPFEFGLERILDGIDALIRRRRSGAGA